MRIEAFWALGALTVLLCLAFSDVVFRGRTLLTSAIVSGVMGAEEPYGYHGATPRFDGYLVDPWASAWQWEPLTAKANRLYLKGHLPLWNAGQGFGAPLAANMHSSVYYLPSLPLLIAPTPIMWDLYLLARLLAAGMFTYAFCRLVGLGRLGAIAAGAAFMLSSHFMLFVSNSWISVDVLVAALLFGIEKIVRGGGRWWALCLTAVVSTTVLGGMPESTFVVLVFAAAYTTWRLTGFAVRREFWKTGLIHAGTLLTVTVLGVGTSGFLLIPFAEYVQNAHHLHRGGHGLVHLPIGQLISLFMPYIPGPPWGSDPAPARLGAFLYSGIVVPTLGIVAIVARRDKRTPAGWFFLLAAVLGVAKAYGIAINWIGSWPLFNLVHFPRYAGGVICFSLAVLAGFGLDAIARGRVPTRRAILATIVIPGACVSLLFFQVWWHGAGGSLRYLTEASLVAAGLVTALQTSLRFLRSEQSRAGAVAACCAGVMLIELLYLAPPRGGRAQRHPADVPPPAVNFVREDAEPHRVFAVDGILYPNTSSYFNLNDIRALDALYPSRYMRYIREFLNESIHDRFTGDETLTSCRTNVWFDLLGVKYVFSAKSSAALRCAYDWTFISEVLEHGGGSPHLRRDVFRIDGEEKPILFQHPPSEIRVPLRPDPQRRMLAFSIALAPGVWDPAKGDGVEFEVSVVIGGHRATLFSRWVDPKSNARDRRWIDGHVDLGPYLRQDIELVLSTKPGGSSAWDWAGWGDLRLGREDGHPPDAAPQYVLVWDGGKRSGRDLRVYQNTRAFPRAFVVHSVESVADGEAALRRMKRKGFDPTRTAVVEGLSGDEAAILERAKPVVAMSPAEFLTYEDSRVAIKAVTSAVGVLVLTDIFYPGWSASVDGKPVRIYPANFAFRGVLVPAGEHIVEFVYRPMSFVLGSGISLASLALLLAFVSLWPRLASPLPHQAASSPAETRTV